MKLKILTEFNDLKTRHIQHQKLQQFKQSLKNYLNEILLVQNERQTEEKIKNLLNIFYSDNQIVPQENRMDFVIKASYEDINKVIIEVKYLNNKNEFFNIKDKECNRKVLWELILYFFKETYINNIQIKHLVATNGIDFFIFKSKTFDNIFNKSSLYDFFVRQQTADYQNTNEKFYEVAKEFISNCNDEIECEYINIRDTNNISQIYKIFSPENLLGEITERDYNAINNNFYKELLHIIGLEEIKGKNKVIIKPKDKIKGVGSLIQLVLAEMEMQNEEIAIELSILWINRLLFLKLLEAQLIKYKKTNSKFLILQNLKTFGDANDLFFKVLGKKIKERDEILQSKYKNLPYLNSSLFEINDIEKSNFQIGRLHSDIILPYYNNTCLSTDKANKNKLTTLQYILSFLDSYNFGAITRDDIEDNDKIINASILGKIFEKINGYKDGAIFTPGYITMYMCKEVIERVVIDKFNSKYSWNCSNLTELYNKLDDTKYKEYNEIINNITICDPAVGSGHFLVSALNELIRIKSFLHLLYDKQGKKLKCDIKIKNDELIITKGDTIISYDYTDIESQQIQETIFNEKKILIENCLFGVDINSNSVNICRLRLWIELLKHSYYKQETNYIELETLPNIDINIKCGNSLISVIPIEIGKQAQSQSQNNGENINKYIKKYKQIVKEYKNADDKNKKREFNQQIIAIKNRICPTYQQPVFVFDEEMEQYNKEQEKNKIYKSSIEWMIEFPEVLDEKGKFKGFDIIIGNPPYGVSIKDDYRKIVEKKLDKVPDYEIYYYFINLAYKLLKDDAILSYIIPNTWLFNIFADKYRKEILENWSIKEILDCSKFIIFEPATVRNTIVLFKKNISNNLGYRRTKNINNFTSLIANPLLQISKDAILTMNQNWGLVFSLDEKVIDIISKIKSKSEPLFNFFPEISQGLIAYDKYKGQSEEIIKNRAYHYNSNCKKGLKKWLWGEDINKYSVIWNNKEYIDYCDGIANPREPKFFVGKRMLIREITNPSIYAAITTEEMYNDPAILIVKDNNERIEIALGILNSKLATFYHFNHSPKATKGAFPKILVKDIKEFPLPNLDCKLCKKISDYVQNILKLTNKKDYFENIDSQNKVKEYEKKIDIMVYKLYELTYEEVLIVDKDFSMSKEEYNNYKI